MALKYYKVKRYFPGNEKLAVVQQIKRAALSVHLNIAEGSSKKLITDRNRYFEIARGSVRLGDSIIKFLNY